ncbi:hypothetical protein V4C53_21520 [Paraburkholderia azotifigens]|uniref:hypothetical protein n=1 Tax=Paraburkholderia azotifigens TaxID=2057004 RepID=UPI0031713551
MPVASEFLVHVMGEPRNLFRQFTRQFRQLRILPEQFLHLRGLLRKRLIAPFSGRGLCFAVTCVGIGKPSRVAATGELSKDDAH